MTKQDLIDDLEYELKSIAKEKAKFIEKFNENADYALNWSNELFRKAAREKVLKIIITDLNIIMTDLNSPDDLIELEASVQEIINDIASCPSFSTSPTSNLSDTYTLQAFSEIRRQLETFNRKAK